MVREQTLYSEDLLFCTNCLEQFSCSNYLIKHIEKNKCKKKKLCERCSSIIEWNTPHKKCEAYFKCLICGQEYKKKQDLQKHILNHKVNYKMNKEEMNKKNSIRKISEINKDILVMLDNIDIDDNEINIKVFKKLSEIYNIDNCVKCYKKRRIYNYNGLKPLFCYKCREEEMINVVNQCKTENCVVIGNKKYKNYCFNCFVHLYPNEPISRNYRIKEKYMVEYIKTEFQYEKLILDSSLKGCSKRRPDIFIDKLTHGIIIECDENQHEYYDNICDNKRLMDIFQDIGNRPLVCIKFNPDKFINQDNKLISSCFSYNEIGTLILKNKIMLNHRLNKLRDKLLYYIDNIPEKEITIEYLFYNQI